MKALLLTQIYPSLREPTRGPYNHNVFRAVSARCDVRVLSPQPFWTRLRRPQEILHVPHETQTGLDTLLPTYWSVPKASHLHGKALYASLRPLVARIHQEFPFDVILAAWAYPDAFAAARLARDFNCALVIKTLGSDINEIPRNPKLRPLVQEALHAAGRVVTVSSALRDRVVELGISPDRVMVQHNGVNGDTFFIRDRAPVRAELGLSADRFAFCYVGRLSHEKGVDVLLQAFHHLNQSGAGKNADLHLVGGGDQEENLRAQAEKLNLSNVYFHGMQPHKTIPLWLSACDAFCLPSRREGCPNVVLEALASGRPVVASHVGGVPELVSADNGILVPSENPESLAAGMQEAMNRSWNPDALRSSVEFLSWDAVGAMYHQALQAAVAEKTAIHAAPAERDLSGEVRHMAGANL